MWYGPTSFPDARVKVAVMPSATRKPLRSAVVNGAGSAAPWAVGRVTPGRLSAMLKAIVAIEMEIEQVEGSAKLNQQKSDADHVAVVAGLRAGGDSMAAQIADRMVALRPHLSYEIAIKETCDA